MDEKLTNCISRKDTNYIPIWFMRQAGRYLPEFMEVRKKNQNSTHPGTYLGSHLISDVLHCRTGKSNTSTRMLDELHKTTNKTQQYKNTSVIAISNLRNQIILYYHW